MDKTEKQVLKKAIRQWTAQQVKASSRQTLPVMIFAVLAALAGAGQMWCVALVIGTVLVQWHDHLRIIVTTSPFIGFIVCVLFRCICIYAQQSASARASVRARRRIRREVLQKIVAAGPALLRSRHSAQLTSTIIDRIEALDGFFAHFVPMSRLWFLLPCMLFAIIWWVQPFAAYVLGICGLCVPIGQALFGIGAMIASRNQFLAMTRLQTRFLDRVRGIATIVLAGRVQQQAQQLYESAEQLRKRTMKILRVAFFSSASIDCAMVVAFIVLAVVLGQRMTTMPAAMPFALVQDKVICALFAFLMVPEFFAPLRALALAYQDRAHAQGAASEILELPKASSSAGETQLDIDKARGVSVTFEHVSFAWDQERGEALHDVSFYVPPRTVLTISGRSGAGKSTLMELLLGFATPLKGRILVDGHDLADCTQAQRAALMSWIGQDPVIFSGTIRDNILFARPDACEEDFQRALEASGVSGFLSKLPDHVDTYVGEGGFGLSGGQAQRVVLARAWLKDAPLLLLDEPTSHLDARAEEGVFDALARLAHGRTVLIITHTAQKNKLKGPRLALEDGRIKEIVEA